MIRKLRLALAALVPVLALAAPKSPPKDAPSAKPAAATAPADAGTADEGALPTAPLEGGAKAADGGKAAAAAPDTYTIRPGDTLWDLSGRFLNNPWYWPKIWSYNPDITNPHWISPGNTLKFYPSGDDGAVEVVPVKPEEAAADVAETEDFTPPKELEDVSKADLNAAASEEERDAVSVAGAKPIGYSQPRNVSARHDAFVTARELDESGVIRASFEEKFLLTARDAAYVTFKQPAAVKLGEDFTVYRTLREVKHPVTHDTLGFQTVVVGKARVVAIDSTAVSVSITASFDAIERGDRLGPWVDSLAYRAIPPKPNAKRVRGVIVGSPIELTSELAQSQMVFVDRGRAEGVEEGNRFTVVRSGDPNDFEVNDIRWDPTLPVEEVGSLLVVDVKEHTCTTLVTKSLQELRAGDRVEMRVADAK